MNLDRATLARFREQARQARRAGHYAQAAHLERQAVELAGTLGFTGERTRALLWEGYSLRQAGQDDLALAVLLQVIHEPATDPADRFSALIALLHLSLERKPARFCRALLEQGRRDVLDFRQPWSALLDFLEGELAFRRGDFDEARAWHERAWAGRREAHPQLTPATHLWARCRVAFRRHDLLELEQLTHQLTELRPNLTVEQRLVQRAKWLRWRAQQAAMASPVNADVTPVEQARAFLTSVENQSEPHDFGIRLEALRVVALVSDGDLIDTHLRQKPLRPDTFETALGLGDLALNQAQAEQGLPVIDVDYGEMAGEVVAAVFPAPDSRSMTALLDEARRCYQAAARWAADQDQRLETGWYGETVRQRLAWLAPGEHARPEGR